jgi:hypothetical protein
MKSFAELDQETNGDYLKLLAVTAKLSKLFSDKENPYVPYRIAENIFCRSFNATNLSRGDSAFDAEYNSIGIGLKTFICERNYSTEKVAEFNKLSAQLREFKDKELAIMLSEFRNKRIDMANNLYGIEKSIYHIVARRNNELLLFETDYDKIEIDNINSIKKTNAGLQFHDGKNFYTYNYSKSTLFRRFEVPQNVFKLTVDIVDDPYQVLLELFEKYSLTSKSDLINNEEYVILPLYGIRGVNKEKFVFEHSGLNQWNAAPRSPGTIRNKGEVYIPVPIEIHRLFPDFFPDNKTVFSLQVPTGEIFKAKMCQSNDKGLMTNPNKALSDWLLRNLLKLESGELATIERLNELGFDSVRITKDKVGHYRIDKAKIDSYEEFILTQKVKT